MLPFYFLNPQPNHRLCEFLTKFYFISCIKTVRKWTQNKSCSVNFIYIIVSSDMHYFERIRYGTLDILHNSYILRHSRYLHSSSEIESSEEIERPNYYNTLKTFWLFIRIYFNLFTFYVISLHVLIKLIGNIQLSTLYRSISSNTRQGR